MGDPYKFLSGLGQAHLLNAISILFNHDETLKLFFFSHKEPVLRLPAKNMIKEAYSLPQKDQLLIRVALDYWNRRGYTKLADLLDHFDYETWIQFLHSLATLEEVHEELIKEIKTMRIR